MRVGTCEEIESLIEREALGWSETDQLRVEQHLADCEACAAALALARFVRDALQEAAHELPTGVAGGTRQALFARRATRFDPARFDSARSTQAKSNVAKGAQRSWLGMGLASVLTAAAVVTLLFTLTATQSKPARLPTKAPASQTAVPSAERPEKRPPVQTVETPASDDSGWIETKTREEHTFAQARVTLEPGTRARFDVGDSTLQLARGRVDVDGEASLGQRFFVQTQRFRVEASGARFSVTPDGVSVTRERVQVLALDGRVLAAELAAGTRLSLDESGP